MNDSHSFPTSGLYAVTPADWPASTLLPAVSATVAGGARLVQYRAKPAPDPDLAREMVEICQRAGAALIINDDAELAAIVNAQGVHLGRDDIDIDRARQMLGDEAIIGASCYNDLNRARQLAAQGADYLAFGSLFASPTKPDAVNCPPEVIRRAGELGLPIVAIGGITLDNAEQAIAAGADFIAVISGLFEAEDIEQRARQFQELFRS